MLTVSDMSPVSNLAIIGQLDLLQVQFGILWIPEAVGVELRQIGHAPTRQRIEEAQRAGWLKTKQVNDSR
jgi:predicted nucleic acid-binding protein